MKNIFLQENQSLERMMSVATDAVRVANENKQLLDRAILSTQFYREVLSNLIVQNQYTIQAMLSEDLDHTDYYRDLLKATNDATMLLNGKNPNADILI